MHLYPQKTIHHTIFWYALWVHDQFIFTPCKIMGFPCPIHNRVIIVILIEHFMLKGGNVMINQITTKGMPKLGPPPRRE